MARCARSTSSLSAFLALAAAGHSKLSCPESIPTHTPSLLHAAWQEASLAVRLCLAAA